MDNLGDLKLDKEFTDINPDELPEELKSTYKNMQSHFTKRTQEVVAAKKKYDSSLGSFEQEKNALTLELEKLKGQNQELQTSLNKKTSGDGNDDIFDFLKDLDNDNGMSNNQQDDKRVSELVNHISKMEEKITGLESSLKENTSKTMKVLQYERDLADVAEVHKELFGEPLNRGERRKLIDFAIENSKPDMHDAYEAFTRDRLINKKADERANQLYKERLEKEESFAGGIGGDRPTIFARDEKTPKTMSEATKQVLKEIRTKV